MSRGESQVVMPSGMKILVGTRSPIFSRGIASYLEAEAEICRVETATSAAQVLEVARRFQHDVAIVDTLLPDVDVVTLCRRLREVQPLVKIIAIGDTALDSVSLDPLRAGVDGYVLSDCDPLELVDAVRHVLRGEIFLSTAVTSIFAQRTSRLRAVGGDQRRGLALTSREAQILEVLATGKSNFAIASALGLSERTVENHIHHIFRKLGVHDRTQAIFAGVREGYLPTALARGALDRSDAVTS